MAGLAEREDGTVEGRRFHQGYSAPPSYSTSSDTVVAAGMLPCKLLGSP